ncbi:hypothetical protein [Vreelandella arcis]|uniref:Phasin protein n=1 Tax=Vreelandella arcis TaxID=416873 RepID=A0A1G9Z9A6_9GAMM|nr:hypothetical protein [Halomonas arcis]SDN17924.1 hypothetical protein SAMN04487951_10325 [Halomonas arcis]
MTTLQLPKSKSPPPVADDSLLDIWYQPWVETTNSAVKLQRIWLETVNDALRHELDFISTVAPFYIKLTHCMTGLEGPQTPTTMASCYHRIAGDMSEATYNRMRRVSELSDDFRERIWFEL